ncbi:MAG: hypothetical protein QOF14_5504 [Hyphomicrobiales bacterium]|jgi:hypothetical protein|nr:hypothetical protein [Hyphomicrobiales bacterium]
MKLTLRLDPKRLRRWHVALADTLVRRPDTCVSIEWNSTGEPLPTAVALLFALERLVYGLPADDTTNATPADLARFSTPSEAPDVVLDFTTGVPHAGTYDAARTWRITFDGVAGEAAALAALVHSRTPVVTISDAATGAVIVGGHPGTETAGIMTPAYRDVLARTTMLIVAALDGAKVRLETNAKARALDTTTVVRFAVKSLARAAVRRLYLLCYNAPHWRVGWRFVEEADVIDMRAHPKGGWRDLPDDRRRFYADPFPIEQNGRLFVLVEDFAHALGYGVISAIEFDGAGPVGDPRPVLDTGSHLSYPFVFEHRGAVWMVPESVATGTVDLYRAEPFPDRWVKEATLISGLAASDATLLDHDGRWWMFATVRAGGAFSDALHIWSAADLHGPWRPHQGNPVLVDIATARPGGRIVRRNGRLIRPFQDCTDGYGAALGLAEITRLDDQGFAQRVETVLRPGPEWPGRRLHTLNRAGRLECIDGSASARRF